MEKTRYTETQNEIIKNRECLETIGYYMLNGFAYDDIELRSFHEKTINEVNAFMVERNAQLRKMIGA